MNRFRWTAKIFNRIDWDNFGPAYRKLVNKNLQWNQKYCSKKLPTGCRLNKKQSKFEARYCTCWDPLERDDHLIQCPKRNNFRNRIYSEIENLRPTLDPVLHNILNDGI